jgi:hypothetical protein
MEQRETNGTTTMKAIDACSRIVQTEQMVGYFRGVFTKLGLEIAETGEQLTATHTGDSIKFTPGLDADVEAVLKLTEENIRNLVAHTADGVIDPAEAWHIVSVMFTPLTQATLASPKVSNSLLRIASGAEQLIHVHLVHPTSGELASHSLIFAAGQWLVSSELLGKPQRTFWLTPDQALEFQRRIVAAIRENTISGWWSFAEWYRAWRVIVSARPNSPTVPAGAALVNE